MAVRRGCLQTLAPKGLTGTWTPLQNPACTGISATLSRTALRSRVCHPLTLTQCNSMASMPSTTRVLLAEHPATGTCRRLAHKAPQSPAEIGSHSRKRTNVQANLPLSMSELGTLDVSLTLNVRWSRLGTFAFAALVDAAMFAQTGPTSCGTHQRAARNLQARGKPTLEGGPVGQVVCSTTYI